ncbi:MAG: hypothetical protein QXR63_07330 [Candidatus Bathyarchaeia archaeon]
MMEIASINFIQVVEVIIALVAAYIIAKIIARTLEKILKKHRFLNKLKKE